MVEMCSFFFSFKYKFLNKKLLEYHIFYIQKSTFKSQTLYLFTFKVKFLVNKQNQIGPKKSQNE
jgi:hypothetical protein